MSCSWEGNRRSDIALTMRHRLKWCTDLEACGKYIDLNELIVIMHTLAAISHSHLVSWCSTKSILYYLAMQPLAVRVS